MHVKCYCVHRIMHTPAMPPPTPQRNQHRPPATAAHQRPLPAHVADSTPSSAPVQLADLQSILSNVVGAHAVQAAAPQPSKLTGIFGYVSNVECVRATDFPFTRVMIPCSRAPITLVRIGRCQCCAACADCRDS
jgi:hypothetical protein